MAADLSEFGPLAMLCGVRIRDLRAGLSLLALLGLGLALSACRSSESAEPETGQERAGEAAADGAKAGEATPTPDPEPAAKPDPKRAAKLEDLDELCAAVDHDYKDGTLGDYYAEVEPRTDWGKAQRDKGNESITPARLLEKAVAELDPGGEDPAIPNCHKLLDYIDDVE